MIWIDAWLCRIYTLLCTTSFYGELKIGHLQRPLQLPSSHGCTNQDARRHQTVSDSWPRAKTKCYQAPFHSGQLQSAALDQPSLGRHSGETEANGSDSAEPKVLELAVSRSTGLGPAICSTNRPYRANSLARAAPKQGERKACEKVARANRAE